AATATDDAPQLTHTLLGQAAIASDCSEDLALLVSERQCKRSLECDEPSLPGLDRRKLGTKQARISKHPVDAHGRSKTHDSFRVADKLTTLSSGAGKRPASFTRSTSDRPSCVSMNGMNTASNERMPVSTAVTCPLIQSRRIDDTAK